MRKKFSRFNYLLRGRIKIGRSTHIVFTRLVIAMWALGSIPFAVAATPDEMLRNNDTQMLERLLMDKQQRFENGTLTEIKLRNAFRTFYSLDPTEEKNLMTWAASSPESYVAHLALGIYFMSRGVDARGGKSIDETPQSNLDQMSEFHEKAMKEFRASLLLTRKPYLSFFHMLPISTALGDHATSLSILRRANKLLPENSLVRNRYIISLTPRWGGSYEQMDKFILVTMGEGVSPSILWQLNALEQDDIGHSLKDQNQHAAAMEHYQRALTLGARVGGTFSKDFLKSSRYNVCSNSNVSALCQ